MMDAPATHAHPTQGKWVARTERKQGAGRRSTGPCLPERANRLDQGRQEGRQGQALGKGGGCGSFSFGTGSRNTGVPSAPGAQPGSEGVEVSGVANGVTN
eukprot:GGOE01021914.1.p1 GENE.GGOE01021914.1~~GGOE01021914.1.p1  ORF type:complete len:111 (-),score=3.56 GGOE01021914.1:110-409(-)